MAVYAIRREVLLDFLKTRQEARDLVTAIFASVVRERRVQAHLHTGYWEDLGSIKSYHAASLGLTRDPPPFDFHMAEGVIYTRGRNLPASHIRGARVQQCLVTDGCIVQHGAKLFRSVIGVRSRIGRDVSLRETIIIGADNYETEAERAADRAQGLPPVGIGDQSVIERAIVDKDCRIGCNVQIVNRDNVQHADG